jgi:mRNA interferase MazF
MVAGTRYIPERGDIVWLSLDPQAGHEQAGRRLALIVSPAAYNGKTNLCLACPITNNKKGYPFEVVIPNGGSSSGVVLSDQVKSLDWNARNAAFIEALPASVVDEVIRKINVLLV